MKSGKSLTELAVELDRQKNKRDYLADTTALKMTDRGDLNVPVNGHSEDLPVNELAHNQIAQRVGIPAKYYDKMKSQSPELMALNVNHWFNKNPEKRMVRTLDGNVRAFLSNRYRPLDNYDLAEAVLPKIQGLNCTVESCEVTEKRLYLKVITDRIVADIKKGDAVQAGLVISNSEVGCGSLKVEPMIYRLVCLNGLILPDQAMKKYHVGKAGNEDIDDGAAEFFRDSTRLADDRAFFMKVQDIVAATLDMVKFNMMVNKLRDAADRIIDADPVKVLDNVGRKFDLTDAESGSIMQHLIKGADLSQYGLINAITRAAQDVDSYDRSTDLERIGGEILELPQSQWKVLSTVN